MAHFDNEVASFRARFALLVTAMGLRLQLADIQCADGHDMLVMHLLDFDYTGLVVIHKDDDFNEKSTIKLMDVVAREEFLVGMLLTGIFVRPVPTFTLLMPNGVMGLFNKVGVVGYWNPVAKLYLPYKG